MKFIVQEAKRERQRAANGLFLEAFLKSKFESFRVDLFKADLVFLHFPDAASKLICLYLGRGMDRDAARTGFCGPHGQ
jgi:hypothetical protein